MKPTKILLNFVMFSEAYAPNDLCTASNKCEEIIEIVQRFPKETKCICIKRISQPLQTIFVECISF